MLAHLDTTTATNLQAVCTFSSLPNFSGYVSHIRDQAKGALFNRKLLDTSAQTQDLLKQIQNGVKK